MYSELQAGQILKTIALLQRRISERFPESGLSQVCMELHRQATAAETMTQRLRKPAWLLRTGAALGTIGMIVTVAAFAALALHISLRLSGIAELLQATEAGVNVAILMAMALFFLYTLETRVKRAMTLKILHKLRSIVHIIDMHQLTKDPEFAITEGTSTSSSPQRSLPRFLLTRYLDYCSEMLSLTSKVAALYAQHLNDPVVLEAVGDIETLAASLSSKIWQKIMIVDNARAISAASGAPH